MNDVVIVLFSDTDRAAEGLAGAASGLAALTGGSVQAVVASGEYQPEGTLDALTKICRTLSPRAVLLSNDAYSQEIAPRLAHRLGGSAVGDGTALRLDGDSLLVTRQVYGGRAQAVVRLKRTPAVAWLRARSFAPARDVLTSSPRHELTAAANNATRVVERKRESQAGARLEDARVIVSGGRGIGGPEGFNTELQPLARLLGAQLAASRAACDAGWVPPTWQVGQTGKKVAPDLYLAIAITGASQHMAGISEAKNIAAINIDPDAPIFKHARFGIVEDYRKVVPLLREKLERMQK